MNLIYTEQAFLDLEESLGFIAPKVTYKKLMEIRERILDKADTLFSDPFKRQEETHL